MLTPFQCLLYCSRVEQKLDDVVLAASGSCIYSFNATNGSLLSRWSSLNAGGRNESLGAKLKQSDLELVGNDSQRVQDDGFERPEEKRKLSSVGEGSDNTSTEIVVESGKGPNKKYRRQDVADPTIIILVGTSSKKHIVVITGEDKCLRVFDLQETGSLNQISERHMPKRPCSVVLTSDESIILCADKFGDVYAMPLMGTSVTIKRENRDPDGKEIEEQSKKSFVPAATSLTVHTKRNQQALKNQQNAGNKAAEKKNLEFEHQLLLGHVSLLTDLVYITLHTEDSELPRSRSYVLTADRDEHIRISRGLPQTHIIESYCQGHTEFISRLCIPPWRPEMLVSGGGDDFLLVWNWLSGTILQRLDIKYHVNVLKRELSSQTTKEDPIRDHNAREKDDKTTDDKIAVSGLWIMRFSGEIHREELIVACEGIPALFVYSWLDAEGNFTFSQCLNIEGNILDLTVIDEKRSILYSMDNVHRPLTTTVAQDSTNIPAIGIFSYSADSSLWIMDSKFQDIIEGINRSSTRQRPFAGELARKSVALSELLYGIENLRKRGQED